MFSSPNSFKSRNKSTNKSTKLNPPLDGALLYLLFILVFSGVSASAVAQTQPSFDKLSSSHLQILSHSACNVDFRQIRADQKFDHAALKTAVRRSPSTPIFGWTPTGHQNRTTIPYCSSEALESAMIGAGGSTAEQSEHLRTYFKHCAPYLKGDGNSLPFFNVASLSAISYDLCDHPGIRKVVLRMPDGTVARGFLGLKPGKTKRPLVIIKCGVFCNAGDTSHRFMMMHLFDESPFHVLALGNITGLDYVRDNGHVAIGGLDESRQILHAAKIARSGPLASRVSTVHFAGVSLGSQAGLFASYISGQQARRGKTPALNSALAICPVVDLRPSINGLFTSRGIVGAVAQRMLHGQIQRALEAVPLLGPILSPIFRANSESIPSAVAQSAAEHYATRRGAWAPSPFEKTRIRSAEDLWRANDFLAVAQKPIATPTLVIASDNDSLVRTLPNATALASIRSKSRNNRLSVVTVPAGDHCGLNLSYGWQTASALFRGFILANSPETLARRKVKQSAFHPDYVSWRNQAGPGETYYTMHYEFQPRRAVLKIKFKIYVGTNMLGCGGDIVPEVAGPGCFRWGSIEIPFEAFTNRPSWARAPVSKAEAEALTRWANANMVGIAGDGRTALGRGYIPSGLSWFEYN